MRRIAVAAVVLGIVAVGGRIPVAYSQATRVASVEGITEYRLPNGVRYLLFPDESSPKVTVNLTVFVGSRHEGYGETGMAHLLEHMLFKGSKRFPDIDKAMQERGASFNGTTWVDRTNYFEILEATDENLEFALKLEADRLVNSFIKREDLAKEMTVVRNEFERGENDPENILSQRMMAVAYEWHNYGKSTIGNRADIERVPIERLREFYRKYYQPDNIMVVIAGRFNQNKAHKWMAEYFGALKRPARKLPQTYTEEPPQDGERLVVLRRVGSVSVVGLIYHTPAAAHPDCAAVQVLGEILTATPSGRLYEALVKTKKATSVSSFAPAWHDPGVIEIQATVAQGTSPEEVRDIMLGVVEGIKNRPITTEEVERAKLILLARWKRAFNRSSTIAIRLSEWAAAGDWRLLFLHRDRIKGMTVKHVNDAARKYLVRSNRTLGVFIPIPNAEQIVRAEIPPAPDPQDLLKDYKGGKAIARGEAFDPTPENIEKRLIRKRLSTGAKVALLPKKTRGETVVARMTFHFGNEESLKGKTAAVSFLGPMLTRGTEKYTRQQLRDELARLRASLSVGSSLGSLSVSIQAERSTLPQVLGLAEQVLRHPTFPESEFELLKQATIQQLRKSLNDPYALARNALSRALDPYPKDDVRYVPTIQEQIERIEKVTLEDVKDLYRTQLGATHAEIAVVGDFDPQTTVDQLESIVADWRSKVPYRRIRRVAKTNKKGYVRKIVTPDKKNAMYVAGYLLPYKDSDPEYAALDFANYVLGGSGLKSLLFDRLRNQEGLCYGAGTGFAASSLDPYSRFIVVASCNPDNIGKVDKVTLEVLNKVIKKGISPQQLEEYRKGYLRQQKLMFANDGTLASVLRENLYLDRTMDWYARLEQQVQDLTLDQVNRALRMLVQPGRLYIYHAGDFRAK